MHFRDRFKNNADFLFTKSFLLRTTDIPMGPKLNDFSAQGVTGQNEPLVGLSWVTDETSGESGYYPIFGSTTSNIAVNANNFYWVNVYTSAGSAASASVSCNKGDVIIGIRYGSHQSAAASTLSLMPDIQCSTLIVQEIKAYGIGTTHTETITQSGDTITANTVSSVKSLTQCMGSTTSTFAVSQSSASAVNSCTVNNGGAAAPSFFIRLVVEKHRARHKGLGGTPGLIDLLITSDDIFGSSSLGPSISVSADAEPWEDVDILGSSPEFLSGTIIGGGKVAVANGLSFDGNSVSVACSNVWGCEHGKCNPDGGCVCDAGFSGASCDVKGDPCGAMPCFKGQCSEDFSTQLGYKCACPEGYSGDQCQTSSDPCQKLDTVKGYFEGVNCGNGTCTASGSSYQCSCNPGYTRSSGTPQGKCDSQQDDCVGQWRSGPCTSACTQQATYLIVYPGGSSGKQCPNKNGDTQSSSCTWGSCLSCSARDCNGRGSCSAATGSCTCNAGYSGLNCEQQTDTCSMTTCGGHGNCFGTSCTCLNGWTSAAAQGSSGTYCTLDPCAACPNGQCDISTGLCHCVDGQPGQLGSCLTTPQDCAGSWGPYGTCGVDCLQHKYFTVTTPSMNGGATCSNSAGDKQSQACSSGLCCQITSSQCLNGASFLSGSCECLCSPGWQGGFCQTPSNDATGIVSNEYTMSVQDAAATGVTTTTPAPQAAPAESTGLLFGLPAWQVYAGAGGAGLLLLVGAYFVFFRKKAKAKEDPYASLEGMEGMEDIDFAALGLDAAPAEAPK